MGRLQIGGDSFPLSATGLGPLLTFSYQAGGATQSVSPGGAIIFPAVSDGQTASVQFTIANAGTTAATVASIGIGTNTSVFGLTTLPALPFQLNPGNSATFNVNFAPLTVGALSSTLLINNQAFSLSGFGTAPPALPAYQFTGASATQQPFQQPALGLSLNGPYSIPLTGNTYRRFRSYPAVSSPIRRSQSSPRAEQRWLSRSRPILSRPFSRTDRRKSSSRPELLPVRFRSPPTLQLPPLAERIHASQSAPLFIDRAISLLLRFSLRPLAPRH